MILAGIICLCVYGIVDRVCRSIDRVTKAENQIEQQKLLDK